jgi:hypothetical protein
VTLTAEPRPGCRHARQCPCASHVGVLPSGAIEWHLLGVEPHVGNAPRYSQLADDRRYGTARYAPLSLSLPAPVAGRISGFPPSSDCAQCEQNPDAGDRNRLRVVSDVGGCAFGSVDDTLPSAPGILRGAASLPEHQLLRGIGPLERLAPVRRDRTDIRTRARVKVTATKDSLLGSRLPLVADEGVAARKPMASGLGCRNWLGQEERAVR